MTFFNRKQAGIELGKRLLEMEIHEPFILALPRGGVPVAHEIAVALGAPLDVLVVRKIGAPFHEEIGIGAITEDLEPWINPGTSRFLLENSAEIEKTVQKEKMELKRRLQRYRGGRPLPSLSGKTVILVDDGIATGVSARAASRFAKGLEAEKVILAVPVCSAEAANQLRGAVDEFVCLEEPEFFLSVGHFYEEFEQVSDEEVLSLLKGQENAVA